MPVVVAGLDVWKRGWVGVFLSDGRVDRVETFSSLRDFMSDPKANSLACVGLDIPVGLPLSPPRRADALARAEIGPRRSSVFNALPLDVIEERTYASALSISRTKYGQGISRQSYALRERILEAQEFADDDRVVEVHPEVSFAAISTQHLQHAKKTWNGQVLRRGLLVGQGIELPEMLVGLAGSVPVDDVLDAAAVAWSANRVATGNARTLPSDPDVGEGAIFA